MSSSDTLEKEEALRKEFWSTMKKDLPKPGKVIRHRREYVRDWEKKKMEADIELGIEDYIDERRQQWSP